MTPILSSRCECHGRARHAHKLADADSPASGFAREGLLERAPHSSPISGQIFYTPPGPTVKSPTCPLTRDRVGPSARSRDPRRQSRDVDSRETFPECGGRMLGRRHRCAAGGAPPASIAGALETRLIALAGATETRGARIGACRRPDGDRRFVNFCVLAVSIGARR
jgi:hypothetical protein